ncbi:methanogenesis marker 3 protein [Methanolobus sp. ZRKC3]|uniref:methyl-coenzyme M reductase-associated protein Mmp3 n=1 Tax=Methanolobus sp. ZRKC3 TaxID=3125786 RepID=UPI00324B28A1
MNGHELKLPEGSSLEDAIRVSDAPHKKGTAIGILIEEEGEKEQDSAEYIVKTSKGEFRIELHEDPSSSRKRWLSHFEDYKDIPVRWTSRDAVAFGPFGSDMVQQRGSMDFKRFEIMFAAGGGDSAKTHLIFTKNRHSSEYGAPGEGTFARIISGKHVLLDLDKSDRILGIEPVVEWEEIGERICTTDLSTKLKDGSKVFTYINIEVDPAAPEGAEHLFAVTRDGTFNVDFVSSSFISDHRFQGELVRYENFESRSKGAVFVRTVGYGAGKLFISTDDRNSTIMHSVIGHVVQGIELVKMAESGQKLMVRSVPDPVMLLGMSNVEAEAKMTAIGVQFVRDGYTGDDAYIIKQTPETTIEILGAAKVSVTGVDPDLLVDIELYDDLSPKTLDFFRHATDLQYKPVGSLPVLMTYENTYIFKAEKEAEKYKEIFPENSPEKKVLAGEIGVTNQAAKRAGMVGIKTSDDDMFGPTGERLANTNIIGRIIDINKLEKFKDGDIMYIIERSREDE